MKLRDLEYLIAIERFKHFGKAAEYCNVSQPALSSQVKKLENILGITLFERNIHSLKTTEPGEKIIRIAEDIIQNIRTMKDVAKRYRDPVTVPLKIGIIETAAPYMVPFLCDIVHKSETRLKLVFRERRTHELYDELTDGKIDVAVVSGSAHEMKAEYFPIFEEPLLVALHDRHPLVAYDIIPEEKLPLGELILLEEGHCLRYDALALCNEKMVGTGLHSDLSATSLATAVQYVSKGFGATLVPALGAMELQRTAGNVVFRAVNRPDFKRQIGFLARVNCPRKYILESLCDVINTDLPDNAFPLAEGTLSNNFFVNGV